ncbi:UDP-N-acetylmuramoyl-tripeptide--D-alanyl-D-alanine ligase [Paenibacillus mendelii]|uniref:UDP-N-acetylmuramoyl-tripeptide--D-alanyl-D-alanine ligase n=1 Tax=Paenibacillus mendelii TaxID=206163 RepID=A0ABV6JHV8_9BACL|nr:UDP-N-acetylmuramoyl-tripeptide--D-alanyl-D-alanine ligase [Paenibacillus mendelii]MCQ6558268.1 UDP-N-acetylmuramoyl-tripeptide--D-alanyl-D-alanine ligase [Paenibacillus mendelii]
MIKRTLGDMAVMSGGTNSKASLPGTELVGVTTDSRRVQQGQLFIPLVGEHYDGHDFVQGAFASGAGAALWQSDREVPKELAEASLIFVEDTLTALQRLASSYRQELKVRVIGVTGSNGKTTTKDMAASVLAGVFRVHKTEGNLNNHIGLPLTVLQLDETVEAAVIEMGMSDFGEIELLTRIAKPDIAIITNIGDAHLLQLGSREGIAKAKLEIASGLTPGGILLYNGDEPLLRSGVQALGLPESIATQTFGIGSDNDWSAQNVELGADASRFDMVSKQDPGRSIKGLRIPVLGQHNVANALAAIAAAMLLGVPQVRIQEGLSGLTLTGMRIEPLRAANGALLLSDAYNANPTAVRAAVDLVAHLSGYRRKWLVLGDMLELGPQEAELHAGIGEYVLPDKADAVLTYGALSRHTAEAAAKNFGIGEAGDQPVIAFEDKNALIEWLQARLAPEDLVLVKGSRGMRMEEIIQALQRV